MKKYVINSNDVSRKTFFRMLKTDCTKVSSTQIIAGWCGVDTLAFDKQKYQNTLRNLRRGMMVCFLDAGHTYAYYGRSEKCKSERNII